MGRAAAATMHDETTRAKKQSKMRAGGRALPPSVPLRGEREGGGRRGRAARYRGCDGERGGKRHDPSMTILSNNT